MIENNDNNDKNIDGVINVTRFIKKLHKPRADIIDEKPTELLIPPGLTKEEVIKMIKANN